MAKAAIERGDGPVAEGTDRCRSRGFVAPSRQIKASRPVTARPATRMTVSTHTSSRTRYAPTVTATRGSSGNQSATDDVPGLQGSRRDSSADDEPTPSEPRVGIPWSPRAAAPPRQPHHSGFLRRFPTATKASWPSPARLERWLRSVGYSGGIAVEMLYRHVERGISAASRQNLMGRSRPVWSPPRNTDRRDHPDRNTDPRTFRRIARSEDIHMHATLRNGQSGNRSGTDRDCRK